MIEAYPYVLFRGTPPDTGLRVASAINNGMANDATATPVEGNIDKPTPPLIWDEAEAKEAALLSGAPSGEWPTNLSGKEVRVWA